MHPGLSALVVHDLKNRLAVHEQRLAELLAAHPDLSAELVPLRSDTAALHRRLVAFLTLYRDDAHGLSANEQEEDPARVLAQAARFAASRVAGTGVVIETDTAGAPSCWYFDAYLVGLALEAAVDNAARFACGRIRLFAAERDIGDGSDTQQLVFGIDDDGPGLDADVFAGPRPDSAQEVVATGLGTELCRTVARLHECDGRHGEVRLGDRPEGGARFEMRLP
jgi:K+-sensing histidine kinase KdpD